MYDKAASLLTSTTKSIARFSVSKCRSKCLFGKLLSYTKAAPFAASIILIMPVGIGFIILHFNRQKTHRPLHGQMWQRIKDNWDDFHTVGTILFNYHNSKN